ncbi:MAG: DMT family transporter [Alphaproteobacteria bacterium]|nr:DMT family transporter [Alphaproteobacteria bacterium]
MRSANPAAESSRLPYIGIILTAGVCFSLTGVLVRVLDAANGWQVLVFRSVAFLGTVALFLFVRYRRKVWRAFADIGWIGVGGALGLAFGTSCYIWALYYTTVANTVFLFGALPFINSFNAWFLLGERVDRLAWVTMALALAGVAVMIQGAVFEGSVIGNVVAIAGLLGYSSYTMSVRSNKGIDMMPALCVSAVASAGFAFAIVGSVPISNHDIGVCLAMGVVSVGLGYMLYTWGARRIRAGEISLLSNVEIILGPLWALLVVAEVPSAWTLAGGAVLAVAIAAQAVITFGGRPA